MLRVTSRVIRKAIQRVLLLSLIAATPSLAHVSLKNGNFFIPFKDLVYPGGFEPKIERVYNSKAAYLGMFGWGWGTEYEVNLEVSADGSVIAHEYGGGASNRFVPVKFTPAELKKAVEMLSETARSLGTPVTAAYKEKLRIDADFRGKEWARFLKSGKVKPRTLAPGEQLVSTLYSYQYITKVKEGYVRKYDTGKVETFDDNGRLIQVADANGNFIQLTYGNEGYLKQITDNQNRKMFFTFNKRGRVELIQGESGKRAEYKYNDKDELISSKDVDGNAATYKYSSDNRKNMVELVFTEKASKKKTTTEIAYWGRDKYENVKSVRENGETITEYDYAYDKPEKNYSWVSVAIKDKDNKAISTAKYEYWAKASTKAFGEPWTYKMATTIDGDRTETVYNECCSLPVAITRAGESTHFSYDGKGRLTEKSSPYETTRLKYDLKAGKVARVDRFSKINGNEKKWSEFKYDNRNNLVFATNSDRKKVKLVYDKTGRIAAMVDQDGRKLTFQYNEASKPVKIRDEKLGEITVTYNNAGDVQSVDTPAGRRIAVQVTSAFQNLLEIVRPAGVNLSF